jgi:hypothetical protein
MRTFAPALRIEGNAGVRPLNVRRRRFSRTQKAPRGHCLGGRSFCKKVSLGLRGSSPMNPVSVKKVSDLLRESVGFRFVVVLNLLLLNFPKYCG